MYIWLWVGFIVLVLFLLALDLGVFNRNDHAPSLRESLGWTAFWIGLALCFNFGVYHIYHSDWMGIATASTPPLSGKQAALQFLTGYLVEKSLSLDNIFVIALIFGYFSVPLKYQHRVLFWGILGALVMRGVLILAGAALIQEFTWTVYVFGAILLFTAAKLLVARDGEIEPEKNPLIRLARRWFTVTADFEGSSFFVQRNGRRAVTPLFLVLLLVESTDLIFAVDSIPAIFAVTTDPFLVFTSNIFAILGLRSLYFALAGLLPRFRYLKMSLVFLLAFIGVKMLLVHHYPMPTWVSLSFICGILSIGVIASVLGPNRDTTNLDSPISTLE